MKRKAIVGFSISIAICVSIAFIFYSKHASPTNTSKDPSSTEQASNTPEVQKNSNVASSFSIPGTLYVQKNTASLLLIYFI
ncbi:hypothetical protein SAMN04487970_10443 [Paenibacillus tianmuensis]|uniref:Uncharacterized protein n=1 Tax=Paenibacillus tianmuensis TaxID=624147 RepID=A0A1G4T8L2_9BACL|nr:hypothetical protein SAMN04487970_10443 [Paenibacillus tianmuensis]